MTEIKQLEGSQPVYFIILLRSCRSTHRRYYNINFRRLAP